MFLAVTVNSESLFSPQLCSSHSFLHTINPISDVFRGFILALSLSSMSLVLGSLQMHPEKPPQVRDTMGYLQGGNFVDRHYHQHIIFLFPEEVRESLVGKHFTVRIKH